MTRAELEAILARNPQLSLDENPAGPFLLRPQSQPLERPALESPVPGTQESGERIIVCIVSYRLRPCDPDNFAGGCKALLDSLVHAGLIPDDNPEQIELQTRQVKVGKRREQHTEIILTCN